MSALWPGGSRVKGGRIFSPKAIAKVCEHKEHREATGSLAGKPHANTREIERRQRRLAK